MIVIKQFDDLYPYDIEQLIGHELAKQLTYDLFIIHQSCLNEDCAIYILENENDYSNGFMKAEPYMYDCINEYEYEHNEICYHAKIINDTCIILIGKNEWIPTNEKI